MLDPQTACAVGICAYLAANYNAPMIGIALAGGGTPLLSVALLPVLAAAWVGEGPANAGKRGWTSRARIHHH